MQPIQKMCHLLSIMKPLGMKHEEMRITSATGRMTQLCFIKNPRVWRSRIKGKQKGGEWTWLRRSNDQSTGIWKKSSSSVGVAGSGNHIACMSESCVLLQLAPSTNFSVISRLIFTDCGKCFTHY